MDRFFTEVEKLPHLHPFYLPVRKIGYLPNDIGDVNKKKMHPGINFVFILSGSRKIEIDGQEYQMTAPGLLVERPGIVHVSKDDTPFEIMYFAYNIKYLETVEKLLPDPFFPFCQLDSSIDLWLRTSQIASLCMSARVPGTADRIDRLVENLISDALIYIKTKSTSKDNLRNAIYEIASYLEFHYIEDIDLDQLIKRNGFSKRTFLRRWKDMFKLPPGQFIADLRVQEAKRMLEATDLRISEIAEFLNFNDTFYFSRMFKKHAGLSPAKYRKETAK